VVIRILFPTRSHFVERDRKETRQTLEYRCVGAELVVAASGVYKAGVGIGHPDVLWNVFPVAAARLVATDQDVVFRSVDTHLAGLRFHESD
jgi:hypothetical protein